MSQTAVIWDERYLLHDTGLYHPERPERLLAIKQVLDKSEIGKKLIRLEPRLAIPEEIALVHDFEYVRKIETTAGHDIQLDPDTPVSPKSWEAACLAVGGMLVAVDWVLENPPSPPFSKWGKRGARNAFAFVRPPGHHAERARAMGFCLFNNVAIAAEYALRKPGIKKVLIVDYDVHHGNGTQWSFYDRPDVFYISTHRYPFYPGTGARKEEGKGKGKGYTLNVLFPGGEGDEEYLTAFDKQIIPVMKDYQPDLILVSAGYDAHRLDPLGGMNVTADGFAQMTGKILEVAEKTCGGRVVMVLEGGYSLEGLSESVEACLKILQTENRSPGS
ncbi:MAG: histone deacetylase [Deltaproteobacteria bacterium]|nr:histone deacetylase [Deltaproteobacteria bacterium]